VGLRAGLDAVTRKNPYPYQESNPSHLTLSPVTILAKLHLLLTGINT